MIAADCRVKTGKMSVLVNPDPDPETRCGLRLGRRAGPIRASREGRIVELGLHCRVDHAFGNEVLITIEANTERQTRTRALCGQMSTSGQGQKNKLARSFERFYR